MANLIQTGRAGEILFGYKSVQLDLCRLVQGDREIIVAGNLDFGGPTGYGLSKFDGSSDPIDTDHYLISSGDCLSLDQAIKEFKADYKNKGPYREGKLFMRLKPSISTEMDFGDNERKYKIICRFSIAVNG